MRTRFCFFGACARAKRRILDNFGPFWLVLAHFGVLMLLPDAPGTWYTHLAHPEHIGDTRKQFPTCKGIIPSILTPRGAWAAPWFFCGHKNSIKVSRTHFPWPRGSNACFPAPGPRKMVRGTFLGILCAQNHFSSHFRSCGGTLEWPRWARWGIFWYQESISVLNNMLGRRAPCHPAKDELSGDHATKISKSTDPIARRRGHVYTLVPGGVSIICPPHARYTKGSFSTGN